METVAEETIETSSVRVTRQVDRPLAQVWDTLMRPGGASLILGPGGELGNKGEDWQADDGTYGITRSFHPKEQIRFSWHAYDGAPRTLVDLQLHAAGEDATALELVHEHLPEDADRDGLRKHWEDALDRIATAAE